MRLNVNFSDSTQNFSPKLTPISGGSGTGADGKSAYEIAVDNGFRGTEEEWLESLKGEPGATGEKGADGISVTHSWDSTTLIVTSASGTSSANLKGEKGEKGDAGPQGLKGDKGETGEKGVDGESGVYVGSEPDEDALIWIDPEGVNEITPNIGENGNWFVGTTDTGVPAEGKAGADGYTPQKGTDYFTDEDVEAILDETYESYIGDIDAALTELRASLDAITAIQDSILTTEDISEELDEILTIQETYLGGGSDV